MDITCISSDEQGLCKHFTDASWKLVSPGYLKNFTLRSAVSSWHSFLSKLGVRNVLAIRKFNESVSKVGSG